MMVLSVENLAYYLVDRHLVTTGSVVDGDFVTTELRGRHRVMQVIRQAEPGLIVKQIREWREQEMSLLGAEAACYWLSRNDDDFAALAPLLPTFRSYDPHNHVLVIDRVANAESLAEYHWRLGAFPEEPAARLGDALGSYHRSAGARWRENTSPQIFPRAVPWPLLLHDPSSQFIHEPSPANWRLIHALRSDAEFSRALDELRGGWRVDSFIHGDIKWDNCLVSEGASGVELKLIDWEIADYGDACWDAGAIFQAYLLYWMGSVPPSEELEAERFVERAATPVRVMWPALRAYWRAYLDARGIEGEAAAELLERCTRYAAGRLIQTAYECPSDGAEPAPVARALLRLSRHILTRPRDAIRDLLGLADS